MAALKVEWDEAKRASNLRKHGLDFADIAELIAGHHFMWVDDQEDYGEERWVAIGEIKGRTARAAIVFRGPEWIRVLSLRRATRRERALYQTGFAD